MINNNLPLTNIISYYDVEADLNLTQEEWTRLYPQAKQITIADKSGANFRSDKEGYGPCQNTWCGCDCSKEKCDCPTAEASIYKNRAFSIGNCSASGNAEIEDDYYIKANGQASRSLVRIKDWSGDIKILSDTLGVNIGRDKGGYYNANIKASLDLLSLKTDVFESRVGPNFKLGYKQDDEKFEVNAGVFGITFGKKVGVSFPFGEVKIDKDKCIIQQDIVIVIHYLIKRRRLYCIFLLI